MKKLLTTVAMLAAFTVSASATTISWNFGEHGFGALPNVQAFDSGGFFLSARGFDPSDHGTALFSKNGGTNEVGLGLVDDPSHEDEITGNNFIQLNMDGLRTLLTNFQFSMSSVDNQEGWKVFGSNDDHPFQFTLLASSGGLLDNSVHSLADGWDNYNFFYSGGVTGSSNVLLHSFSADVVAQTPLPASLPFFGAGLVGLVALVRKRKSNRLA
jgi:hypothetical protein